MTIVDTRQVGEQIWITDGSYPKGFLKVTLILTDVLFAYCAHWIRLHPLTIVKFEWNAGNSRITAFSYSDGFI
jgi:hypothetical protein